MPKKFVLVLTKEAESCKILLNISLCKHTHPCVCEAGGNYEENQNRTTYRFAHQLGDLHVRMQQTHNTARSPGTC